MKHLQEEITPPSEEVPDIPYSLEQIILKCTQKNSERRYDNMEDLIKDLKHSLVDPDGDFVQIIPQNNADTVIITEDELNDIRDSYDDADDYDDDSYDEDYDDEYDDDYDDEGEEHDSDEVNPRMNKIMKILTIVVAVLILVVLGVVVGKATGVLKFNKGILALDTENKIKVPNLVGKTEGEAKQILEESGLKCKVTARRESKKYDEGYVIEQNPEEGKRVKKGYDVEIVVSSGKKSEEGTIPDVSGQDEASAQKALENAGFTNIKSEAVYSEEEQGTVIGTNPTAGTKVSKDTEITMQVSKGSEKITEMCIRDRCGRRLFAERSVIW